MAVLIIVNIMRIVVTRIAERRMSDLARRYSLGKSVNYLLGFAGIVATLMIWFGNVTGWAAYLGILSAGLAVALQVP